MTPREEAERPRCMCPVPDPVMQADMRFYCYTCSLLVPAVLCGRCTDAIVPLADRESALRAAEARGEQRGRVQGLLAFVEKIAAYRTCEDDKQENCTLDSGPYCGTHYTAQWIEDEIAEARTILRTIALDQPHTETRKD